MNRVEIFLVVASATVIVPWILTEVTHALGWGVKR